ERARLAGARRRRVFEQPVAGDAGDVQEGVTLGVAQAQQGALDGPGVALRQELLERGRLGELLQLELALLVRLAQGLARGAEMIAQGEVERLLRMAVEPVERVAERRRHGAEQRQQHQREQLVAQGGAEPGKQRAPHAVLPARVYSAGQRASGQEDSLRSRVLREMPRRRAASDLLPRVVPSTRRVWCFSTSSSVQPVGKPTGTGSGAATGARSTPMLSQGRWPSSRARSTTLRSSRTLPGQV